MAEYVNGRGLQPELLMIALRCDRWGSLPKSGGVLDQPDWLMTYMDIALNVYRSYTSYRSIQPGKEGDWKKRNEGAWECLKRYGLLYG